MQQLVKVLEVRRIIQEMIDKETRMDREVPN
jgi:hypothetical protein